MPAINIICLLGPSSAGKSTLCEALAPDYDTISFDESWAAIEKLSRPIYHENLEKKDLFKKLSPYMSEEDVLGLTQGGELNISKGPHLIKAQQFTSPAFEGLTLVLRKAGFDEKACEILSPLIHDCAQVYHVTSKKIHIMDFLVQLAIEKATSTHKPVLIDVVPLDDNVKALQDRFKQYVKDYETTHGKSSLHAQMVLAYSPPAALSARIQKRNANADRDNTPRNKRIGLFPFNQLSTLITGKTHELSGISIDGDVTNDQLMKIAYQHRDKKTEGRPPFKEVGNAIKKYITELKKYGLVPDKQESTQLTIRSDLHFDLVLDTSTGSPSALAARLKEQLQQTIKPSVAQSTERMISTLSKKEVTPAINVQASPEAVDVALKRVETAPLSDKQKTQQDLAHVTTVSSLTI